jgi:penicillin-binding protein-related factor A (putative recombinase)
MAKKNELANWFEDKISEILKGLMERTLSRNYRYPDMKSTGHGYANKQPADYYLLTNGLHIDIECKTSENHSYFKECYKDLIKDHQMTAARKIHRAGGRYIFLFYSGKTKIVEIWDGKDLYEPFSTPRMKLTSDPIFMLKIDAHYTEFLSQFIKGL